MEIIRTIVNCALCKASIVVDKNDDSYKLRYHSNISKKDCEVYTCSESCYDAIVAFLQKPDIAQHMRLL